MASKTDPPRPRVHESDTEHTPLLRGVGRIHPERLTEKPEDARPAIEHGTTGLSERDGSASEQRNEDLREHHSPLALAMEALAISSHSS